ncbi:hypothetical protein GCM10023189_40390 [Nibrella saemangeumensis]|uniref:Uncharacterized protein n=1 Tax=Nibrella saemangeumensis TaxID=1084526 RepID=A0ABP8NB09_9BACT
MPRTAKRTDLAPLPALRQVLFSCQIKLEPFTHQVSALPSDPELEIYFVPHQHMNLFKPYHRPGDAYKNLKLVNYERPAISLTFFVKHKYSIDRQVSREQALQYLKEYRDELFNRSFLQPLRRNQQKELQQIDDLFRSMLRTPDIYQFCLSNYHHYYRYWYCSYRYFEDDEQTKTATANEHLLKHTQRVDDRVNERMNIVFVDTKLISRPVPYDNKLIDRELETYPQRIEIGKTALYIKKQ